MKEVFICIIAFAAIIFSNPLAAQQQEEKTPEEMAIIEAEKLETELNLTGAQLFYVDSILRANFNGLSDDMEALRNRGSQDLDSYTNTREKWIQKTIDAFKGVLDEQQHIRYLKYLGKGKEYKKGKDGKYYLKDELKKQKR